MVTRQWAVLSWRTPRAAAEFSDAGSAIALEQGGAALAGQSLVGLHRAGRRVGLATSSAKPLGPGMSGWSNDVPRQVCFGLAGALVLTQRGELLPEGAAPTGSGWPALCLLNTRDGERVRTAKQSTSVDCRMRGG